MFLFHSFQLFNDLFHFFGVIPKRLAQPHRFKKFMNNQCICTHHLASVAARTGKTSAPSNLLYQLFNRCTMQMIVHVIRSKRLASYKVLQNIRGSSLHPFPSPPNARGHRFTPRQRTPSTDRGHRLILLFQKHA